MPKVTPNSADYPLLREDLAVRLSQEGCQIRRLERIDDIIKLGGSAWLFLQQMKGRETVEQIVTAVCAQHQLDPETIAADLQELIQELVQRGVVLLSPAPVAADRPYLHTVAPEIRSSLHMDITHRCNERCIHCLVPRQKLDIPLEKIHDIVLQAAALGFVSVSFSGGEPFLHAHFWDVLDLCRDHGFYFTVFTNGLNIKAEEIARLARYQPEQIRISLYSMNPAIHDMITTVPGSFHKTMACIEAMHAQGIKLYVNCPVMKHNFDGFKEVAAFCDEHGFERNMDPVIQPTRDRKEFYHGLQLTYEQAKEVTGFQQDADELVVNVQPGEPVCNVGDDPSVDASLDIYPCPGLRKPLGNLGEQSLAEVLLDNEELERMRNLSLDNLEVCQQCAVREGCYRCHGHAYQETEDYTACCGMDRRQAKIRRELMIERGSILD